MRALLGTGIALGKKNIDRALGRVKEGLNQYQEIQARFRDSSATLERMPKCWNWPLASSLSDRRRAGYWDRQDRGCPISSVRCREWRSP
jgi:hypothetical protein